MKKSITSLLLPGVVARQQEFDIIHAHDWLTYPAGVHAKMVSGKPLCIHVHATDFDRSRGKVTLRFMPWRKMVWIMRLYHVCIRVDSSDCYTSVSSRPA